MVAHIYHPKLQKRPRLDHCSRPAWAKKFVRPYLKVKKLDVVVAYACHPSYGGKCKIGESAPRPAWAKSETLSQK
jgi:hypothetical protein